MSENDTDQTPAATLARVLGAIAPADADAAERARARHAILTKPAGSLGLLEELGAQLAAIAGACPPPDPEPAAVGVFAADHGVHARGVSPWPQDVTAQMVANFVAGGAVINVLARQLGARVEVIDVGVATPVAGATARRIRPGTADLSMGPAMSRDEALAAVAVGIETAEAAIADGARCLITGDMGIGNTTASAAMIAAFTGASAAAVTGRGTGIDDETLSRKAGVIASALAAQRPDPRDPIAVLSAVGGLEQAALTGFILAGAAARVPVILDGVIAAAAALAAAALHPHARDAMIAGHLSAEPGAAVALGSLGLTPLLDLGLRLGEGSGAALALPLVRAAAQVLREVATFDSAGVAERDPSR